MNTPIDIEALRARSSGRVVAPADDGWDAARQAWNLAVDQHPAAVAFPASADDVSAAVDFALGAGLRVAVQGTGHGAAPYGDLAGTLLLRTTDMTGVRIDADARRARVEAGTIWGDVVAAAAQHGLAALHGSAPDTGVIGNTLGGGIGYLSRPYGLASNRVTAVELVTADGQQVRVDADNDAEHFWALRGGGGSFGAVTALEFSLLPLETVYAGALMWPWEQAAPVLQRWREWVGTVPDEVTSMARIMQIPPFPEIPEPIRGRSLVAVNAAYVGDEAEGARLLEPLRELGPELDMFATMPAAGLSDLHGDPPGPTPGMSDSTLLDELTPEAIDAFVAAAGPGSGSPLVVAELRQLGGALATAPEGGGALAKLDAGFLAFAVGVVMDADSARAVEEHSRKVIEAVAPWGSGRSYLNFRDRATDTRSAYPAETFERLRQVKSRVDPQDVFRANHPIAPAA